MLGIDAITLVRYLALSADVADHQSLDVRLHQIMQPLRLRPFLERDMNACTGVAHERRDCPSFCRHRRSHPDRAAHVPHANHDRCLVHAHRANRLFFHGSRPFLSFVFWRIQTDGKGRAFNMS